MTRAKVSGRMTLGIACLATLLVRGGAGAAPGSLDTSFGSGGKVTTSIGAGDYGHAVAIDGSGRIVVAGSSDSGGFNPDFAVVRYTASGSLDTTFGGGGKVTTPIGASEDNGYDIALDGRGRIVVAGDSWNGTDHDVAVVRYMASGSLDTTFGSGGKVITPIGAGDDIGVAVALDGRGRIVVAGAAYTGTNLDFAVVRYTARGRLDKTFGSGGKVTTPIGASDDFGHAVAIDGSGRIVVAGFSWNGTNNDVAVVRYTTSGSLDTTFGSGGKVTTPIGAGDDFGDAVAIDGSGRIVVAGDSWTGTDSDIAVVRYTASGSLDTAFGSGGKVITPIGAGGDYGNAVAIDGGGRIVVVGASDTGTYDDFAVVRYTASGSLDTTFGSGGKVTTSIGAGGDYGDAVAIDGGGRIVVAGYSYTGAKIDFAVVRYQGGSGCQ